MNKFLTTCLGPLFDCVVLVLCERSALCNAFIVASNKSHVLVVDLFSRSSSISMRYDHGVCDLGVPIQAFRYHDAQELHRYLQLTFQWNFYTLLNANLILILENLQ